MAGGGRSGVANHVVGLAQQFFSAEAADPDEGRVAVGDPAFEVGGGDQGFARGKGVFPVKHRKVLFHARVRTSHSREVGPPAWARPNAFDGLSVAAQTCLSANPRKSHVGLDVNQVPGSLKA